MLFSQPHMLWGLLAVAIPIAIHLLNLRRYRKVYFSNVERLTELSSERRQRSQLRRWLVLAARVLAIVALVLAFARPTLPTKGDTELHSGATVVSLYIDNSYSMELPAADGTALDAARQAAATVVAAYPPATRFQLATCDLTGLQMHWLDKEEVLDAIEGVEASAASPMLSTAVARLSAFAKQSGAANRHLYVFSDFQTSTTDIDQLPTDSLLCLSLVPVDGTATDNIYVDTIRLDAPAYHIGATVCVEATLANSGDHPAEGVPVRLMADGRERAVATVDVPPHGSTTVPLRFSVDHTGWLDCAVEIDDYPILFDNNYYFTLPAARPVRILEIYGRQPNPYLQRLFAGDSMMRHIAAAHLQHDLSQVDLLMLNEVNQLPSGEVAQIQDLVLRGGTLLVLPAEGGGQAAAALTPLLSALGAPTLSGWSNSKLRASQVALDAPLYRGVFTAHNAEMEMPTTVGHYTLSTAGATLQSLITLSDGSPLLTLTTPGGQGASGSVYLFATPLRAEHTSLVSQALFVPTLYNMALYSTPLSAVAYTLGSADPIALPADLGSQTTPPPLQGGGLSFLPDLRHSATGTMLFLHGEIGQPGIYTLDSMHLAFNLSRRESQMQFLSPSQSTLPLQQVEAALPTQPRSLSRLFLLIALAMLACEVLLIKLKR